MIKFIFIYFKPTALFLLILVLFQCCVRTYYKNSVSVEQAINVNPRKVKRIKVETTEYKKIILDSIYYKDDELYGLLIKPKKIIKDSSSIFSMMANGKIELKIDEDKIVRIQLHNKAKSIIFTVVIIGVIGYFVIGSAESILIMILGS